MGNRRKAITIALGFAVLAGIAMFFIFRHARVRIDPYKMNNIPEVTKTETPTETVPTVYLTPNASDINHPTQSQNVIVSGSDIAGSIHMSYPTPHTLIRGSFVAYGEAVASWFSSGAFTVTLTDEKGAVVAYAEARAQGPVDGYGFIPFTAALNFALPASATGTVVLYAANPSGLAQNAKSLQIPIQFSHPKVYNKPR